MYIATGDVMLKNISSSILNFYSGPGYDLIVISFWVRRD